MAEIRFSCQACHQHITCDEAWSGHQIQCPVCSKTITVPTKVTASVSRPAAGGAPASVPQGEGGSLVPPVPQGTKLALNQNAQQPAPAQQKHIPIRNLAGPPVKKEGPWKTIITVLAVLVILGVAGYMAWPYIAPKFQKEEVQEPQAKAPRRGKKNADTPAPASPETMPAPDSPAPADGTAQADAAAAPITNIVQTGPVIPAVYTPEVASVRIPSGRVNGKVSGSPFLPETIRIDALGASQVLRFTEGGLAAPEREILVYLSLKPGDKLQGLKVEISEDMRPKAGMPRVSKRWKTNPKYAPTLRSFSSGYVMKLELNQHSQGTVKGKVYISLPDNEQTVMAGNFIALTTIPTEGVQVPNASGTVNPGQPGMQPNMMDPGAAEMQRRYGR